MKRVFLIISFIIALVAGTFYSWLNEPKSIFTFGIHLYLMLSLLSICTSFLTNLMFRVKPEENMIITTGGILLAVILNFLIFEIKLPHALNDEIFIMLFFVGQASLLGTYIAVLAKKIKIKSPAAVQGTRKSYPRISVFE